MLPRIVAFDVGLKRVGVAVSCPLGTVALPLEVWQITRIDVAAKLQQLVETYRPAQWLVGDPIHLSGGRGEASKMAQAFVRRYLSAFTIEIVWWDERLTSKMAERALIAGGVRRDARKQRIDKIAAALLLESYLAANPR